MWLILLCIIAFFLGLATDWIWTRWMQNVAVRNRIFAANWSVLVYVMSFLFTLLVVEQAWVPIGLYLVGGWIGTYLAVGKKE